MSDPASLFMPVPDLTADDAVMAASAVECVEAFTERFNARDLSGMDALLHFPHIILSGETLTVWDSADRLPALFFANLVVNTGWCRTNYQQKQIVLVSPRKVHLRLKYSRDDANGQPITHDNNLWMVTFEESRWGIKLRSY